MIKAIDDKMSIKVKHLGQLTRFNRVDVLQSEHFIKLYNKTYIEKILDCHDWIHNEKHFPHTFPIPMKSNNNYQHQLESQPTPMEEEIKSLENDMGFGY